MELGALTVDDHRLPRARAHPRPLRADHRPADEPRLHPARRRRAGPAAGRGRRDPRVPRRLLPKRVHDVRRRCSTPTRSATGRTEGVGYLDLAGCLALGRHRPGAARGRAARGTCARPSRTAATRPTTSTCRPRTPATPTAASGSGWTRCEESLQDRRAVPRPAGRRSRARPVMVDDKKIAWPAQLALGPRRHGQLASTTSATSWASRWRP